MDMKIIKLGKNNTKSACHIAHLEMSYCQDTFFLLEVKTNQIFTRRVTFPDPRS